jgi:hypothetical protein
MSTAWGNAVTIARRISFAIHGGSYKGVGFLGSKKARGFHQDSDWAIPEVWHHPVYLGKISLFCIQAMKCMQFSRSQNQNVSNSRGKNMYQEEVIK